MIEAIRRGEVESIVVDAEAGLRRRDGGRRREAARPTVMPLDMGCDGVVRRRG
jgi:hypothetical protein